MASTSRAGPRRRLQGLLAGFVGALALSATGAAHAAAMTVYKTATCGCCGAWVTHVREAGFDVAVREVTQAELYERKRELELDRALVACHTALVDGYVVEGHVPAGDIHRLLAERPDVAGIAVPGMPPGSPGMEYGGRRDPYNVIAFRADGAMRVFARHGR